MLILDLKGGNICAKTKARLNERSKHTMDNQDSLDRRTHAMTHAMRSENRVFCLILDNT